MPTEDRKPPPKGTPSTASVIEHSGTTANIDKNVTNNCLETSEDSVIRESLAKYITALESTYWNHICFLLPLFCKAMDLPQNRAAEAIICFEFSAQFNLRNFTQTERQSLLKIYHKYATTNMNDSTFLDSCRNLRRIATMVAMNNMLCYKSNQNPSKRVFKCRFQTWKELSNYITEKGLCDCRNECRKTIDSIKFSLVKAFESATATGRLPAFTPAACPKGNKTLKKKNGYQSKCRQKWKPKLTFYCSSGRFLAYRSCLGYRSFLANTSQEWCC